jgi:F0F1-type ATP synthase assembly protein I
MRLNDVGEKPLDVTESKNKLDKAYNLNLVDDAAKAAQESVNGILIGSITGLVVAYYFKQNIYWGAAFGAAVCGLLGFSSAKIQ